MIIKNAALTASPTAALYEFYTTDGDPSRGQAGMSPPGVPDNEWIWCWEYANMRTVSTLPSTQMYYQFCNTGWTGKYDALTCYPNSVAQQISFGNPLSYNWVNAGSALPVSAADSDDAHYIGMLKCMYTGGMIGGHCRLFHLPPQRIHRRSRHDGPALAAADGGSGAGARALHPFGKLFTGR